MWGSLPSSYSPWAALWDPIICLNKPFLRSETGPGVRCYVSMPSISPAEGTHQHPRSRFPKSFISEARSAQWLNVFGVREAVSILSQICAPHVNTSWLTFIHFSKFHFLRTKCLNKGDYVFFSGKNKTKKLLPHVDKLTLNKKININEALRSDEHRLWFFFKAILIISPQYLFPVLYFLY